MKKIIWTAFVTLFFTVTHAQELYVNTEPASNMAAGSIGFRVLSSFYKMNYNNQFNSYRIEPEIMLGLGKKWMIHVAGYASDMYQKNIRVEGGSLYAKYRLYSQDAVHEHFRISAFSKISLVNNPQQLTVENKKIVPDGNGGYTEQLYTTTYRNEDFDLNGNNSGFTAGVVATKLVNRIAASAAAAYGYRFDNLSYKTEPWQSLNAINYTASIGYLLLPKNYVNYNQTNVNLYVEFIGTSFPGNRKSYSDVAPAVQLIIKSIARIDFSYHTRLTGNTERLSNNFFMLRFEYNLLNAF